MSKRRSHCWKLSKKSRFYCPEFIEVLFFLCSEELKEAAEMEITLHDTTGDEMDFFKGVFEDTGMNYDEQEEIFKRYGGKTKSL